MLTSSAAGPALTLIVRVPEEVYVAVTRPRLPVPPITADGAPTALLSEPGAGLNVTVPLRLNVVPSAMVMSVLTSSPR